MNTAYLCVLIAAILPYVFVGYAKFNIKGFSNNDPRASLTMAEGKAKRANNAQANSFEAFPAFAAGVIIAHLAMVPDHKIVTLSILFIILRIIYGFCYILDKAPIRSLVWFGGFICVVSLYVLAINH